MEQASSESSETASGVASANRCRGALAKGDAGERGIVDERQQKCLIEARAHEGS
jgi:hypothetical protein